MKIKKEAIISGQLCRKAQQKQWAKGQLRDRGVHSSFSDRWVTKENSRNPQPKIKSIWE